MDYDQIHAPATFPHHIHMHLMNRKFLAILYCLEPHLFFFIPSIWRQGFFMLAGVLAGCMISSAEAYVNAQLKPRSSCQASLLQELYLWAASFILEFSCCVSHSCPHSLPVNNTVATKVKTRYTFTFTIPRYITAKRDYAPTVCVWKNGNCKWFL